MKNEIINNLIIIARKLNATLVFSNDSFENFIFNIDRFSFSKACKYACYFLDLALKTNTYSIVSNELERIKDIINENYIHINSFAKELLYIVRQHFIDNNINVILDGHIDSFFLENGILHKNLKIFIEKPNMDKVLCDFYSIGADVYENDGKSIVKFEEDLLINVYPIFDISKSFKDKLSYYSLTDNILIESPELLYIKCIDSGNDNDFIEAMVLKDLIDIKKLYKLG